MPEPVALDRRSRRDAPVAGSFAARRWSLLVCSTAVFVVMLDGSIVNVALPTISSAFGTGTAGLQWIVDGYLLVLACGLLTAGALGDRYGRRRVFRTGLVLFGLASAAASLAPDLPALIGARMLQGLGAALLPPSSLSIIASTFPDRRERARAMGTWGAISGLAVASGPLLGGVLIAAAGWRSIFWANVPVIAAALLLTRRYVSESSAKRPRRLDPAGQVLAAATLGLMTDAVIQAPTRGWMSPTTLLLFGAAVVALAGFLTVEHRRREPMLALGFFRDPAFSGAAAIATLALFAISGFTFLSTLYLQDVRGDGALAAGLALLPATAMVLPAAPLAARLTARYGPRRPAVIAAASLTTGLILLTRVGQHQNPWLLAVAYLAIGAGTGMVNPPVTTTAVAALPPEQAGVAAGVTGTARQLGAVLGVAVLGSLLTGSATAHHLAYPVTGSGFLSAQHAGFTAAAAATALAGLIGLLALPRR